MVKKTQQNINNDELTINEIKEEVKHFLTSKIIWVNLISIFVFFIQRQYGFVISEDMQLVLLSAINMVLRFYTHKKIIWN